MYHHHSDHVSLCQKAHKAIAAGVYNNNHNNNNNNNNNNNYNNGNNGNENDIRIKSTYYRRETLGKFLRHYRESPLQQSNNGLFNRQVILTTCSCAASKILYSCLAFSFLLVHIE